MLEQLQKLPNETFDIVSCGWAIAYSDTAKVIKEIYRVLKPGGSVAIIVNRKGTIPTVERAFLKIMEQNSQNIGQVNDIALRLPKSRKTLKKLLTSKLFNWQHGKDGEQCFEFDSPQKAVRWIQDCGALAGTFSIYNGDDFEKLLEVQLAGSGGMPIVITHKFCTGVGVKIKT